MRKANLIQFKMFYLVELVVALAVAIALARPFLLERQDGGAVVGAALSGVALVEGFAVWFEVVYHRGPSAWGFGRATWSIAGATSLTYVLFNGIHGVFQQTVWQRP